MWPEGLCQLKIPMRPSWIKPTTIDFTHHTSKRCWNWLTNVSHMHSSCFLKFSWCNFRCYVLNTFRSFSVWPLLLCTWCFNVPRKYTWHGLYSAEQESCNSLLILSKKHSYIIRRVVIKNCHDMYNVPVWIYGLRKQIVLIMLFPFVWHHTATVT